MHRRHPSPLRPAYAHGNQYPFWLRILQARLLGIKDGISVRRAASSRAIRGRARPCPRRRGRDGPGIAALRQSVPRTGVPAYARTERRSGPSPVARSAVRTTCLGQPPGTDDSAWLPRDGVHQPRRFPLNSADVGQGRARGRQDGSGNPCKAKGRRVPLAPFGSDLTNTIRARGQKCRIKMSHIRQYLT